MLRHLNNGHMVNCGVDLTFRILARTLNGTYIYINETTSEVEAAWETSDDFQASVALLTAFLGGRIESDNVACSWGRMGEDLGYLKGV